MTKEQTDDVISHFLNKHKRMPAGKELVDLSDGDIKIQGANLKLKHYRDKHVKSLFVINGQIFDAAGGTVWHQATAGSLMPARLYQDAAIGTFITQ